LIGDKIKEMRPRDTSPEAWRVFIEIFRKMSPQEKLERTLDLSEFIRGVCEAGIRSQYPDASDREVFLRLTARTLGFELFRKVYGDVLPHP
jgi:hypothetical protein